MIRLGIVCTLLFALWPVGGVRESRERVAKQGAQQGQDAEERYGVRVPDPFRWLEDPKSDATRTWVDGQAQRLEAFVGPEPRRPAIAGRLSELVGYEQFGLPVAGGEDYFYTYLPKGAPSTGRQLWVRRGINGTGRRLFEVGDGRLLVTASPSPDGQLVALVSTDPKVRGHRIQLLRVSDASLLPDQIDLPPGALVGSTLIWLPGSRAVLFSAALPDAKDPYGAISRSAVLRHRLGDPAPVVVHEVERGMRVSLSATSDGNEVVLTVQQGSAAEATILVGDLRQEVLRFSVLAGNGKAAISFLGKADGKFYFFTNDGAPRGRVVTIRRPNDPWVEVIPEQADAISGLDQTGTNPLGMFGDHIVLTYVKEGVPYLRVFGADGRSSRRFDLPAAGAIWGGIAGRPDQEQAFFGFLGLFDPSTVYRLDLARGEMTVFARAEIPIDAGQYEVTHQFYQSGDGTRIPIFVVHKRGMSMNGRAPAWLYGYGALGWVSFIWYQPHILAWLEMGGVYAQPSIRGGGEYGAEWHAAALKTRKMTAVEDYEAAARWLIKQRYTRPSQLVANGGSLSAPLAAAAANRHPELFGAVVIDRPVTDMLRFERFTGGSFWTPEFGSVENAEEFRSLRALSAYHNALQPGCRPPTLVMTGEFDLTAPPLHAFKLTAALQSSQTCDRPMMLKVMKGAGHNFGNSANQQVDSFRDLLAFLARTISLPYAS